MIRPPLACIALAALGTLTIAAPAQADAPRLVFPALGPEPPEDGLTIAVDADDDDEDGQFDARQDENVPEANLHPFDLKRAGARGHLNVEGPLRILHRGRVVQPPVALRRFRQPGSWALQGLRASNQAALVLETEKQTRRVRVRVVAISLLDANNELLDARRDAVGVSRRITNDASLPRGADYDETSPGPENVRIELFDPKADGLRARASLVSVDPESGTVRHALREVELKRPDPGLPFRSPWLRLVGDRIDAEAPGVTDQVLRTALRDIIRVRYETPGGVATQSLRVGRPGDEKGARAARQAHLRIRVLRHQREGIQVIGESQQAALRLARKQVGIANEIWGQCFLGFGRPSEADVGLIDPPPPTLLSVGEGDGLPARGDGEIRFRIGQQGIGPIPTAAGAEPVTTALAVARAIREAGYRARVTENAPTEFGAGRSADILVRTRNGELVTLSRDGEHPLSTDARQRVVIGSVDLGDGLQEFDNMTAMSGTLEERTLLKALSDDDPTTIDLFLVNGFTGGTRQGEAFIEGDSGAIVNTVLLDRNGLRQQRAAWTQAHEVGHVLLDQPFHPDNVGPDRPWLLMDADTALPLVTGPKRLRPKDCRRVRAMSGVDAVPPLLSPVDPREPSPTPSEKPYDRGYERP
jgi:hypothetical protein